MKFTIGELLEIKGNLNKLSEIKDVPARTGYQIAALVRKFREPLETIAKTQNELVRKYAGPPDENDRVKVLPENMPLFLNEFNDFAAEELDIEIKEVKLPEDVKLPDASTLIGLDRFITV